MVWYMQIRPAYYQILTVVGKNKAQFLITGTQENK